MTIERRNQILSKDVISTSELAELLGVNRTYASYCMQNIKRNSDRLAKITGETIKGKCHVQDYLDFFGIEKPDRYGKYDGEPLKIRMVESDEKKHFHSVCEYREG